MVASIVCRRPWNGNPTITYRPSAERPFPDYPSPDLSVGESGPQRPHTHQTTTGTGATVQPRPARIDFTAASTVGGGGFSHRKVTVQWRLERARQTPTLVSMRPIIPHKSTVMSCLAAAVEPGPSVQPWSLVPVTSSVMGGTQGSSFSPPPEIIESTLQAV